MSNRVIIQIGQVTQGHTSQATQGHKTGWVTWGHKIGHMVIKQVTQGHKTDRSHRVVKNQE